MSVRSVAERICAPFVLRRRLPPEFGGARMYVCTRNGGLKYLRRDLRKVDPFLLNMVDEFVEPGMVVWDVGANVGLFTFAAASRVIPAGTVLAIDADVDNVHLLHRTRAALDTTTNGHVEILSAAVVGERTPVAAFRIARRSRASNALAGFGKSQTGGFVEQRTVPAYTLDQLLESFPHPRFVKVDIEGAEVVALGGAHRLLAEVRPTFCIEVARENQAEASDLFKRHRYRFFNAESPRTARNEEPLLPSNALAIPD